jgi:ribose-phosphate pyrophosphokinase
MKIVSGSSNISLAQGVAEKFGTKLVDVDISHFANGEKRVWIKEEVRGENVVLIQSLNNPTDEHIIELLLLADALERLGARHVNLVMPWMGYSLQDKAFRDGEPIAAKVIANLISNSYIKRAFLLDLHNSSSPGFFSIPTQHVSAMSLFIEYIKKTIPQDKLIVSSPDFGGLKRARVFAEKLGVDLVNIDKHRDLATGEVQALDVTGDVNGKIVVVFDDVINSGSTVTKSAEILKQRGASAVHFCATHGIFANNGTEQINASVVDQVIVTQSIPKPPSGDQPDTTPSKIQYLDISQLFVDALRPWLEASKA